MFDAEVMLPTGVAEAGPVALLEYARERRREADRAEASVLVAAAHWADLHPALDEGAAGVVLERGINGRERRVPLAGPGTPAVAEFAPAELGAALRISTHAATGLVGDALELRHRLPRLWRRVVRGDLPAWRARRVADQTKSLAPEAAAYVDDQVSWCAHKVSPARVQRLVEAATLRFDPENAAADAAAARASRGVWVGEQVSTGGTLSVLIEADATDVVAFDGTVGEVAATLAALGDADPLDVRRSKALGVLADPQGALDLLSTEADPGATRPGRAAAGRFGTLYVHLSAAALGSAADCPAPGAAPGGADVARVERLGPVVAAQVREWAGRGSLRVQPVVDLADHRPVDAYEVPARMSEQVGLRDPCCPFPHCGNLGRSRDRDHIEAYDHGDGTRPGRPPPGQTRPDNLAALCRRHHRVKTHAAWRYTMPTPGTFLWTSPHGLRFRVDAAGTTALDSA